ncbi:YdcF family protein [Streptomyces spinosus]|uniref:YdcF family protein n=1 Tax=Streptomyces spinosus TaxID=2872623 RepID=UPI001CEDFF76|nr:YdcF family protein [Streptomyces spinosus]
MLIDLLVAVVLLLFVIGVIADARRFANAVLLGVFLTLMAVAHGRDLLVYRHALDDTWLASPVLEGLAVLLLCCLLIGNGVRMVRKEGSSPANLLTFVAGVGLLSLLLLTVAAFVTELHALATAVVIAAVLTAYFVFLFVCFTVYGYAYSRLAAPSGLDYIVVLGSGLTGGDRVPPLLAGRLDRAHAVFEDQVAGGGEPVLITSGGRGPDEAVAEAQAMADYLAARGVPAGSLLREARSATTEENLRNSKALMDERGSGYRCVIVTNDFHAFRAAMIARKVGVDAHVLGSPTASYFRPSATMREFAAVVLHHRWIHLTVCALLASACRLILL